MRETDKKPDWSMYHGPRYLRPVHGPGHRSHGGFDAAGSCSTRGHTAAAHSIGTLTRVALKLVIA